MSQYKIQTRDRDGYPLVVEVPQSIVDDILRRAAEAIRSEADHGNYAYNSGWEWAADLIDPDEEV